MLFITIFTNPTTHTGIVHFRALRWVEAVTLSDGNTQGSTVCVTLVRQVFVSTVNIPRASEYNRGLAC